MFALGSNRCGWRTTRPFLYRRRGSGTPRWRPLRLKWRSSARQPARAAPAGARRNDVAAPSWLTCIELRLTHAHTVAHSILARGRDVPPASWVTRSGAMAVPGGQQRPRENTPPQAGSRPGFAMAAAAAVPSSSRPARAAPPAAAARTALSPDPQRAPHRDRHLGAGASRGAPPAPLRATMAAGTRAADLPAAWKPRAAEPRAVPSLARGVAREAAPVSVEVPWQRPSAPLVWRNPSPMQAAGAVQPFRGEAHASLSAGGAAPAQPVAPAARPAPAAPPPAAIAAQLRAGQLDPALADRLATEVIRRVERSMRIERERRGQ